jgi:hypothetical protein
MRAFEQGEHKSGQSGFVMLLRRFVVIAVCAAIPASAAELRPDEAKRFIAGKYFSYRCFDGTVGGGRINADGSIVGTIQAGGTGPFRLIALPVGTIRVQSDSICASLPGALIQPCFTVTQLDSRSFRGAIAGLGFAYCDFVKDNPPRPERAAKRPPADTGKRPLSPSAKSGD